MAHKRWTYERAGVPHLKGDAAYNRKIAGLIRSTHVSGVMGNTLGFASLFDLKKSGIRDPLLVASTDGVGTKLELARLIGKHDTIGIDLVAMCVNDLICCGAKPLFFLDYYATGKFEPRTVGEVLKGVTDGCRQAGCALVGGETAIMPGFYGDRRAGQSAQYDIAGFSVGAVDRKKIVSGAAIREGDIVLGIQSSGFHSNGYSLVRRVFSEKELKGMIGRELLTPTIIYVKPVLKVLEKVRLKGIVNITGGAFYDNLPRVMPKGLTALIDSHAWEIPFIFRRAQKAGNISDFDMFKTFNMGIGMTLILGTRDVTKAQALLKTFRLKSWPIGKIVKGHKVEVV
ncbi:MAG TPA: phosphoribosylformylglycinamidine cyclo-ligase [Candidatus Omnitrophota bacterium]|nr:MAG: Phosphoribosylformylglycinamidine cyclo-ligase [Candidatus Omnitrophica bacterium ADurb.Bin314]HOE68667.1 phosphoribosylformylglycinamidine cyclo-ligase [Candidatus Omnitrophota bacterium]HPW64879.1 phosphoribosylformylglycinamidine cyclo-ligase [Candidatus Omnitrophota bacterium]HQB94055.1 phosphoribosylformylglycinamidine cyclo-ligase [Candidatus Omnitrophota bacterium]